VLAPGIALLAVVSLWPWPHAAQVRFLRACENPNGNVQGSVKACKCLLAAFEHLPPLPYLPLDLGYLTNPPVPFWYRDNTGQCGVG
jgi:hypothetical protein